MPEEHRIEFHEELGALRQDCVQLGAMTTEVIPRATEALLDMDLDASQRLIDGDDDIDALTLDIEERVFQLMALQQPMAGDLRFLVCTLRLVSEMERTADLAVNICKGARRIYGVELSPRLRRLITLMSGEATTLTKLAIDAYVEGDAPLAAALDDIDDRLDELQADYVQAIIESYEDKSVALQPSVQLALIGRYYERIGDHAVNIGQRIQYMVTGQMPEHRGAARSRWRREHPDVPPEEAPPT